MATKVGEFFLEMAVDAASGNLSVRQLMGALGELEVVGVGTVGILSKVAETLYGMAKAATDTAVELTELQQITGAEPRIVQQWEKAAVSIGAHTGSVVKSIQAVNTLMSHIASGGDIPAEFGRIGLVPYKGQTAGGEPIMKTYQDLMTEIAKSSEYWKLSRERKETFLSGVMPGSDMASNYLMLQAMHSGKFRPQDFSGLDQKQVEGLTDLRRKENEVIGKLGDIFDKFLLGGKALSDILGVISDKLGIINTALGSDTAQKVMHEGGIFSKAMLDNAFSKTGFMPMLGLLHGARDVFDDLRRGQDNKLARAGITTPETPAERVGKITLELKRGNKIESRTLSQRQLIGGDLWETADELGNGGYIAP